MGKVFIGCQDCGEVFGVTKITGLSIKALKKSISFHLKHCRHEDLVVVEGSIELKMLIADYLDRIRKDKDESDFEVVGVRTQEIIDICMFHKKIMPLHLCQDIAYNMANTVTAIKEGDREWAEELQSERVKSYKEALRDYNLNMTHLNSLIWSEYKYVIVDLVKDFEIDEDEDEVIDIDEILDGENFETRSSYKPSEDFDLDEFLDLDKKDEATKEKPKK